MISVFMNELQRFVDKYSAQPDPVDTEAVAEYWAEVDKAFTTWWKRYAKDEHSTACQHMIEAAFTMLEDLFKEKQ